MSVKPQTAAKLAGTWLKGLRARAEFRLRFDFGAMVGFEPNDHQRHDSSAENEAPAAMTEGGVPVK